MQATQLEFEFPIPICEKHTLLLTHAFVPSGLYCDTCHKLISQFIPQSPEVVGYLTATWAWKYVHGNDWTTQD